MLILTLIFQDLTVKISNFELYKRAKLGEEKQVVSFNSKPRRGSHPSKGDDISAFGDTVLEVLTGQPVFKGIQYSGTDTPEIPFDTESKTPKDPNVGRKTTNLLKSSDISLDKKFGDIGSKEKDALWTMAKECIENPDGHGILELAIHRLFRMKAQGIPFKQLVSVLSLPT